MEIELDRQSGGIFDVIVDGDMVFSKFDVGRFPDEGEVLGKLKAR